MSLRQSLLPLLYRAAPDYLSGEELALRLSCSRAAVWKCIEKLRGEGYRIEGMRNRGYRLEAGEGQPLSEELIAAMLGGGVSVEVEPELSSSNDVLKKQILSGTLKPPAVLLTDYQSAGKGRLGRSFFSPKGDGLYLSLYLKPGGLVSDNLILTAQAAVAVYRAVREVSGISLFIKWVNDLYLGGRKVCGILSEGQANFETGELDFAIVGIGLNLYEPEEGYPREIRGKAASLLGRRSEGRGIDRNLLAARIVERLIELGKERELPEDYRTRNIVLGREIILSEGKSRRKAKVLSILPDGRLEILEEDGSRSTLVYGELSVKLEEGDRGNDS